MSKIPSISAIVMAAAFVAAPTHAQSQSQSLGRGGVVVTPVTVPAVCDGGSTFDITVAALRRSNQLTLFSTLLVGGFWDIQLLDASGRLLSGTGSTVPDIFGGLFYRATNTISGPIPRGTSTLSLTAKRHDPLQDPETSPVLETCTASLTVTAR